jgi:hypothetical protein
MKGVYTAMTETVAYIERIIAPGLREVPIYADSEIPDLFVPGIGVRRSDCP